MKQLFSIFIFTLLVSTSLYAGTYKWIDEDGNVVYSQRPPPSGQFESIRVKPPSRKSSAGNNASQSSSQFLKNAEDKRKNDKKLKAEQINAAKIRTENCQAAKKQFEFYTVYRSMKGQDGEYRRITSDEREKNLQQARQAIKDFCD